MSPAREPTESLLVFSDVHLGSDLNDSGPSVPRSVSIDRDLAAMLAHYRGVAPPADRWRLVIAGDFVDFVGMSIDAADGDELTTEPTPAERAFGLGGAEDHVRLKLRRAAARHPDVFAELAAFVSAGNAVTFISGNHDLEMYWCAVQDDFHALLTSGEATKEEVAARVDFEPWFFHRAGLVYIEHGHQFDPFCATPFVFAPLSPTDPRRVLQSLSDTLLRYIVRRTPGMKEYGHENRGLMSYISWGLGLGARGTARLFKRFYDAVVMLRGIARAYDGPDGARVREEHERRFAAHARRKGLEESRLRDALALHVPPLGRTPRGVLASVMLDRLSVFVVMLVALVALVSMRSELGGWAIHATIAVLLAWTFLHVRVSRGRPDVDPASLMCARAGDLAKLFPASFVVMGHTHVPTTKPLDGAVYINLGSWAEEEPDPNEDHAKAYRAARTHLVVHAKDDRHEAHLYAWKSGEGPHALNALIRPLRDEAPSLDTRAAS
ncbi:MAG: metallophosphoesterase [Labilithrix sp.]|nr:metallophosphoesterase [Labilithrix sp.]